MKREQIIEILEEFYPWTGLNRHKPIHDKRMSDIADRFEQHPGNKAEEEKIAAEILPYFIEFDPYVDWSELLDRIAKAISNLSTGEKEAQWISVEDRLPLILNGERILYFTPTCDLTLKYRLGTYQDADRFGEFTHWIPLPAPPLDQTQDKT